MKYILLVIIGAALLFSCDDDYEKIYINDSDSFIAFSGSSTSVAEDAANILEIPVYLSSPSAKEVTVNFEVSTEGFDNPAILGQDYQIVNSTNSIAFASGTYIQMIQIQVIDNDVRDKDKNFTISLTDPSIDINIGLAGNDKANINVTIADNEHPLALVIGTYAESDYAYSDGSLDNATPYGVTIAPDPDDETRVLINNFWGGGDYWIIATVDIDSKVMTILPGQIIYVDGTYGDCKAVRIAGGAYDTDNGINCTIDDSGNIVTESWAALVDAGAFGNYDRSELIKQ